MDRFVICKSKASVIFWRKFKVSKSLQILSSDSIGSKDLLRMSQAKLLVFDDYFVSNPEIQWVDKISRNLRLFTNLPSKVIYFTPSAKLNSITNQRIICSVMNLSLLDKTIDHHQK